MDLFKSFRESMQRSFDEMSKTFESAFEDVNKLVRDIEAEAMATPGAEKTVTIEETKIGGVVRKTTVMTVIRSRKESK